MLLHLYLELQTVYIYIGLPSQNSERSLSCLNNAFPREIFKAVEGRKLTHKADRCLWLISAICPLSSLKFFNQPLVAFTRSILHQLNLFKQSSC